LPLALVDRKVREVLAAEFDDLHATPGIGPKKLAALITLLQRAALPEPPVEPAAPPANGTPPASGVCEAVWEQWRASVLAHGLGRETLGRFAASLQDLPRSLWRTTLDHYAGLSLAEIRKLKAHGEKRVAAVVDIFGHVHQIASQLEGRPHLCVRIVPKLVEQIESWAQRRLNVPAALEAEELRTAIVAPLLEQVANDAGEGTARIAELRLFPQVLSVQRIARQLGLTRGRVYELLADVDTIVDVRWPEGRSVARRLAERLALEAAAPEGDRQSPPCDMCRPTSAAAQLMNSAAQLFFPNHELGVPSPVVS
jgi:hypothetical protein